MVPPPRSMVACADWKNPSVDGAASISSAFEQRPRFFLRGYVMTTAPTEVVPRNPAPGSPIAHSSSSGCSFIVSVPHSLSVSAETGSGITHSSAERRSSIATREARSSAVPSAYVQPANTFSEVFSLNVP